MKTSEGLNTDRFIVVTEKDLPLHCPMPEMSAWNAHPRVFLPVEKTGEVLCPYCGTHYKLKGDVSVGHGH